MLFFSVLSQSPSPSVCKRKCKSICDYKYSFCLVSTLFFLMDRSILVIVRQDWNSYNHNRKTLLNKKSHFLFICARNMYCSV